MLSCFVRNVPFLWQNTPSNTHAGQAKLEVFKCGESCLLDGKRDNMNMYKARPSSYYMENVTTLSVCLRSAARSYSLCREEYYQEQVGVKPAVRGQVWDGPVQVLQPHIHGGPSHHRAHST